MQEKLTAIQKEGQGIIQRTERSILIAQDAIDLLRQQTEYYEFEDLKEEIWYHKEMKPALYSHLIFHQRVFRIEINRPPSGRADQEEYLRGQLHKADEFFDQNIFLYRYLRSGATHLDEQMFVSAARQKGVSMELYGLQPESLFPVGYDVLVAAIRANELISDYINRVLEELRNPDGGGPGIKPKLVWTDSKTALIELSYALQSTGSFNSGKADLRLIVEGFQEAFQVDLGNYPRTFQEILSRKTGYTNYLKRLEDSLLLRIKTIEDKYIK